MPIVPKVAPRAHHARGGLTRRKCRETVDGSERREGVRSRSRRGPVIHPDMWGFWSRGLLTHFLHLININCFSLFMALYCLKQCLLAVNWRSSEKPRWGFTSQAQALRDLRPFSWQTERKISLRHNSQVANTLNPCVYKNKWSAEDIHYFCGRSLLHSEKWIKRICIVFR